jgi:glycosyltransferase involved in cell wall biosynthesis
MRNLTLSIITINYNNLQGLKKTIASVVNQTWRDFEFIIIDGGSTDGSAPYIKSQTETIDYWVSEPDKGIYNAMNKGVKIAKGEYLLFLNSGDFLNSLTSLEDFINHVDFKGDIIYGDYQFEDRRKNYPDYLTPLYFLQGTLPHQSTFFRKKVFNEIGLFSEQYKIVSDRDFYIRCFLSNNFAFNHVSYPLTFFDLSGISNNISYEKKQMEENEMIFKNNYGIYYEDYKNMILLKKDIDKLKERKFSLIMYKVLKKIKNACKSH